MKNILLGFCFATLMGCAFLTPGTNPDGSYKPSQAEQTIRYVQVAAETAGDLGVPWAGIIGSALGGVGWLASEIGRRKTKTHKGTILSSTTQMVKGIDQFMADNPAVAEQLKGKLGRAMGDDAKKLVKNLKAKLIEMG